MIESASNNGIMNCNVIYDCFIDSQYFDDLDTMTGNAQ